MIRQRSVAAGQSIALIESLFGKPVQVVRAMPNTPALVREGMTALCANNLVSEESFAWVQALFATCGRVEVIPESLMGAAGTVSGASPAWVYMLIEAMADGAVRDGMPRAQAYKFAAQAVQGAAKMVLESGLHPGELKDQVTSPGGTTIEAVRVLEERGFRGAVIDAMGACTAKNDCIAAKAASAVATKKEAQAQEPGAVQSLPRAERLNRRKLTVFRAEKQKPNRCQIGSVFFVGRPACRSVFFWRLHKDRA